MTKQKRWETVNKVEIDAKNPNVSSAFCVDAYFVIFRKLSNKIPFGTILVMSNFIGFIHGQQTCEDNLKKIRAFVGI